MGQVQIQGDMAGSFAVVQLREDGAEYSEEVKVLTSDLDVDVDSEGKKAFFSYCWECSSTTREFGDVEEREGNCWNIVLEWEVDRCVGSSPRWRERFSV